MEIKGNGMILLQITNWLFNSACYRQGLQGMKLEVFRNVSLRSLNIYLIFEMHHYLCNLCPSFAE